MKSVMIQKLLSIMTCLCLMASAPTWADLTKPETQSQTAQAVQDDVNAQTDDQAESKRKKITADAIAAVQETKNALKLLDENKMWNMKEGRRLGATITTNHLSDSMYPVAQLHRA